MPPKKEPEADAKKARSAAALKYLGKPKPVDPKARIPELKLKLQGLEKQRQELAAQAESADEAQLSSIADVAAENLALRKKVVEELRELGVKIEDDADDA